MDNVDRKICPSCGTSNKISNQFCKDCGIKFSEAEPKKFEIIENLKGSLYGSIVCIVLFLAFFVILTIGLPIELGPIALIPMGIGWVLTAGFLYWASRYLKGLSRVRRFTITEDFIEIVVPHKPYFRINWSDIESIEVNKRESMTTIPTGRGIIFGPRFVYFNLIFKGPSLVDNYEFESGKDFKGKSRKKILIALEQYAREKNKGFTGWKWKDKRKAKKEK